MMRHLSPQEFVDAADGRLADTRMRHVAACDGCRRELQQLTAIMPDASVRQVPEPSPLFWNHFGDRVRTATNAEAIPSRRFAWLTDWRTVAISAAAIALFIALGLRTDRPTPSTETLGPQAAATSATVGDQDTWDFMLLLAADLSVEELQHVTAPMTGAADTLAASLTIEQQHELVRLLKAEIGGAE